MTGSVLAQSIVGSKHDLTSPYGGSSEGPCIYCHTPHSANTTIGVPLWNRATGTKTFEPYTSATMDTQCPAQPGSYSLACLGCHDGILSSDVVSPPGFNVSSKHDVVVFNGAPDMQSYPNCERCHPQMYGGTKIKWTGAGAGQINGGGNDLRNDHPISMAYPTPAQDPDFNTPPDLLKGWTDMKFFDNGKIECPTCHNVHNPSIKPFLRKSNANDALCKTCHIK